MGNCVSAPPADNRSTCLAAAPCPAPDVACGSCATAIAAAACLQQSGAMQPRTTTTPSISTEEHIKMDELLRELVTMTGKVIQRSSMAYGANDIGRSSAPNSTQLQHSTPEGTSMPYLYHHLSISTTQRTSAQAQHQPQATPEHLAYLMAASGEGDIDLSHCFVAGQLDTWLEGGSAHPEEQGTGAACAATRETSHPDMSLNIMDSVNPMSSRPDMPPMSLRPDLDSANTGYTGAPVQCWQLARAAHIAKRASQAAAPAAQAQTPAACSSSAVGCTSSYGHHGSYVGPAASEVSMPMQHHMGVAHVHHHAGGYLQRSRPARVLDLQACHEHEHEYEQGPGQDCHSLCSPDDVMASIQSAYDHPSCADHSSGSNVHYACGNSSVHYGGGNLPLCSYASSGQCSGSNIGGGSNTLLMRTMPLTDSARSPPLNPHSHALGLAQSMMAATGVPYSVPYYLPTVASEGQPVAVPPWVQFPQESHKEGGSRRTRSAARYPVVM